MKPLLTVLQDRLRRFRQAREGNVAVTFALAIIPIVGFVGAAVDYSHANSVRVALQAAIDSTSLMLAREAAKTDDIAAFKNNLSTKANAYFATLFNRPEATLVELTPVYSENNGYELTLTAKVNMKTNFMNLVNIEKLDIGSTAYVKWNNKRLRVALALDNSGSMKDYSKMDKLKEATKKLLDQLKNAARKDGDVYVSIIPFSKDVNVGPPVKVSGVWTYPSWVKWEVYDETGGTCSKKDRWGNPYDNKTDCLSKSGIWTPPPHEDWNGCATDRDKDYDVKNNAPNGVASALDFPADQEPDKYCPTPILGQTFNWTTIEAKVDAMTPKGATNQPIGLVWAWHSLMAGNPLNAPAKDDKYKYDDVIILLSDGENTQNRWDGTGTSHSSKVDARMNLVCANAKADGKIIYTVQVTTEGASQWAPLKNCATDANKYFYLTRADQMVSTFEQIGTDLSQLYIAK